MAVNPISNEIYVADNGDNTITVIEEQQVQPIPLITWIEPLSNDQTDSPTPTFNLEAISMFDAIAPTPQAVWYQLDTWQGPWLPASGTEPYFRLTTPTLLPGMHVLYAFATDGQDANSTRVAQQSIGSMATYVFFVTAPLPPPPSKEGYVRNLCRI